MQHIHSMKGWLYCENRCGVGYRRLELYFLCLYWCLVRYILCHIPIERSLYTALFAGGKTPLTVHANDHSIILSSLFRCDKYIYSQSSIQYIHAYRMPLVFHWIYTTPVNGYESSPRFLSSMKNCENILPLHHNSTTRHAKRILFFGIRIAGG